MRQSRHHDHRGDDHEAYYDEDGNVVIPVPQEPPCHTEEERREVSDIPKCGTVAPRSDTLRMLLSELKTQCSSTIIESKLLLRRLRVFLCQPVWIPGRNKKPKTYSRGMLFVLDVFRFGGTFAVIFFFLFVTLNFESFWNIALSHLDPLRDIRMESQTHKLESTLRDKLKNVPTLNTAGSIESNLLNILPTIGPPENRLIIPRLNLNIPIVLPPNDALLAEDWDRLETDIQKALEKGVVHYPGTARPGQAGNFFVTGHSSYYPWAAGEFKSVFARLPELNVGDEYWVYYGGDRHRYIIQEKKEVRPGNVTVLDQPLDRRISTLMTCTPVGTTLKRLVLVAQEVDPATGQALDVGVYAKDRERLPKIKTEMLPI